MTVYDVLLKLGSLLSDSAFRDWVLKLFGYWILIGYLPEEQEQKDGTIKRVWRWGGIVRAFIQQSVETRELRSDIRALVKKFDVHILGGQTTDSDRPPAPVARVSCAGQ